MSSAGTALQQAVVAAVQADAALSDELSGIFDGPPPRARFPYLAIGDALESDWSTKTETGRELRLPLILWDDGEEPARLHRLMAATSGAVSGLSGNHAGWRIISSLFLRTLVTRTAGGPWAGLVEHRIRAMKLD